MVGLMGGRVRQGRVVRKWLMAVLATIVGVVAASAPAGAAEHGRPFKATFSGATTGITFAPGFDFVTNPTATSTFDGRCPSGASWLIDNEGTGHGTQLGSFSWSSTHCTLLTSLNPPDATLYAGRLTFVAADGDILRETYDGVGGLVLRGENLCADTTAMFVGGTGRFAHASGGAFERSCWPAAIQGPVITGLVIKSRGVIHLRHGRSRHR